jgi:hypothetical protein
VHRTGLRCTHPPQIPGSGDFLPKFLSKQAVRRNRGAVSPGQIRKLECRPECVTSLPSWSCGSDSRRPLSTSIVSKPIRRYSAGLRPPESACSPCTGSLIRRVHGRKGPSRVQHWRQSCGAPTRAGRSRPVLLPMKGFLPPDAEYVKATVLGHRSMSRPRSDSGCATKSREQARSHSSADVSALSVRMPLRQRRSA